MPIAPPNSPLLDLMYQGGMETGDMVSREEMMELQREQESRLLGTFFVQAIFLSLAIMLYATWEWSQFGDAWESALFYGLLSFSLQAALYFSYRTMFEDSSTYRKELKRMKTKQKRRMAQMSFEMRKLQTEHLLKQQMGQYQAQMQMANADGVITPQEQAMLNHSMSNIQQTAQGAGMGNMDLNQLAKALGIDQFKLGPIPLGPKMTFDAPPVQSMTVPTQQVTQPQKLDLQPTDTTSPEAQMSEQYA